VHAELVGIKRFSGDVGDELIGGARVIFVVIVAQREIAELHFFLPKSVALRLAIFDGLRLSDRTATSITPSGAAS
jgi:hypothetical protein